MWIAPLAAQKSTLVIDRIHDSYVFAEPRNFRIFLPPGYGTSSERYPVVYWFHGFSGRHNRPEGEGPNYDQGEGDTIAEFVAIRWS